MFKICKEVFVQLEVNPSVGYYELYNIVMRQSNSYGRVIIYITPLNMLNLGHCTSLQENTCGKQTLHSVSLLAMSSLVQYISTYLVTIQGFIITWWKFHIILITS